MEKLKIQKIVEKALEEDLPFEDFTTELLIPANLYGKAFFLAKESLVVCGQNVVKEVFNLLDPEIKISWTVKEGEEVVPQTKIGFLEGKVQSILKGERVALNFLQHLSGIATYVRQMVKKLGSSPPLILDTRKTLPGLKFLQKYAVRVGGGQNHRFSLSDGILIKDNHIKALGGISKVLEKLEKNTFPHYLKIEIEVKSLEELELVLNSKAPIDIVLLDNFSIDEIKRAVEIVKQKKPHLKLEASGGIKLENIENYRNLNLDYLSCGAITHSIKAVDISLKIQEVFINLS